jgi:hypothetical protein
MLQKNRYNFCMSWVFLNTLTGEKYLIKPDSITLTIVLIGFDLWHIIQINWSLRSLCYFLPSLNFSKLTKCHLHQNTRCRSCNSILPECGTTVSWPEQPSPTTPLRSTEKITFQKNSDITKREQQYLLKHYAHEIDKLVRTKYSETAF